ncbi:unannotated protein [freshwater metagenome]|uniref:Unannotated protein n=1 Tax=freshwater metagenome TaxID=449393 RepID=A0A6J6K0V3_9ZZZZ
MMINAINPRGKSTINSQMLESTTNNTTDVLKGSGARTPTAASLSTPIRETTSPVMWRLCQRLL